MDNLKLVADIIAQCNERIRELKSKITEYQLEGLSTKSLQDALKQNESLKRSLAAKIKKF